MKYLCESCVNFPCSKDMHMMQSSCPIYSPVPKPTNYDRLRAKSMEEMAEFLADVVNDAVDNGLRVKGFLDTRYTTALWIEWLEMKCEEEKDFESWRLSEE